jgi:DNA-binding response OmpR family regulator
MMGSNPRILMVDDWTDTANSLATILTLWGHDTQACRSEAEARTIARHYRPDIVLLDLEIPGTNGFQVARELRSIPGLETTIVGVTSYFDEVHQIRALDAGIDYCLAKPLLVKPILEMVDFIQMLDGSSRPDRSDQESRVALLACSESTNGTPTREGYGPSRCQEIHGHQLRLAVNAPWQQNSSSRASNGASLPPNQREASRMVRWETFGLKR